MNKSDTTYIIGSIFSAMTAFFYCCTMWFSNSFSNKLPRYYPRLHTWKWIKEEVVPSQGWYGMQAFAFLAAGAVSLVVYFILPRLFATSGATEKTLKPAQTKILGVVVTLIIVICMAYMLYYEFDKWGIF